MRGKTAEVILLFFMHSVIKGRHSGHTGNNRQWKFLVISTDGTFYAECITWLCHPKQAVEVYGIG